MEIIFFFVFSTLFFSQQTNTQNETFSHQKKRNHPLVQTVNKSPHNLNRNFFTK